MQYTVFIWLKLCLVTGGAVCSTFDSTVELKLTILWAAKGNSFRRLWVIGIIFVVSEAKLEHLRLGTGGISRHFSKYRSGSNVYRSLGVSGGWWLGGDSERRNRNFRRMLAQRMNSDGVARGVAKYLALAKLKPKEPLLGKLPKLLPTFLPDRNFFVYYSRSHLVFSAETSKRNWQA